MSGRPTTNILDLRSFAASVLADREGLAAALKTIKSCLAGPDTSLDLIVQDLCSVPNLFEFIVSASPSAEGQVLVRRILDSYPTDPALVEASSAGVLLRKLSSSLLIFPAYLFPSDIVRHEVEESKVYVENALPVLALLCTADFSGPGGTGLGERLSRFWARDGKHKKTCRIDAFDRALFRKLKVEVPTNNVEASRMARAIDGRLKIILKSCLELLLGPSLAQQLKRAYLSTGAEFSAPQETEDAETVESEEATLQKVQSLRPVLCFENADGFGMWRVIIGTSATKQLQEFANSDRRKCHYTVKKIKQLSKGHFSAKRLNDSSGVPIFEAKVQDDLWLVYQIDVVPNEDEEERQVIRVYDICTHAQPNHIWDVMGQYLATSKGEEYYHRCTPHIRVGSDVYLPACFPSGRIQNKVKSVSVDFSDQDKGELHSLLILEKYVTFSQALLNGLIANKDVQTIFEPTPQERRIVDCTTSCYVLGRSGTGKTTTMLFKMLGIQRAWELEGSDMPRPRQIFVTKSGHLAIKVQACFTKLLESFGLAGYSLDDLKRMQVRSMEIGLVDADEVDQVGIPQKYSALEDDHFPLFVTFDKLARMIAADVFSGNDPDPNAQRFAKFFIDTDDVRAQDAFVTYDVFARTYWPHFPQSLTKGLEPWLVFSEFMGIIKGSEQSLLCADGCLDEEAYCNLPGRSNPTFANQRQIIYEIFKVYCRHKKEHRHHDVADRTHAILKMLMGGTPLKDKKVDYLYIDEAQDNLLIDALLLRHICRNPQGLFWAGDTAQTISAGSSFRFNDLKAFLHRVERARSIRTIQHRSVTDPTTFQLTTNYRSHGGIVRCAHTIIERITYFWPYAIDILQPERGIIGGQKPLFFRDWNRDTFKQFLSDNSGRHVELGAHQCILVRNEQASKDLREEFGVIGVTMTLYESKGLEFDDVLLYNFFEDSAIDVSRWRVLLNNLREVEDLAAISAPNFLGDGSRFAGICSELKLLYVGITRARRNLWIFDKSERSEPMQRVWSFHNQIRNYTPGMDVPRLSISSAPAEWESFGYDLFKHKRYTQAMHCFSRALQPRMVAICEAFHLREMARAKVGIAPQKAQQDAFLTAANAFVASGNEAPLGNDKLHYYRNAADCYVRAGDDQKAAVAYIDAKEYALAARRYRKAGLFDKTLEVLHKYSAEISSESSEELYTVCRLFYCRRRDAVRPHLPLFPSLEEELEFLEDYALDVARTTLLEDHGRYLEAAELHLSENRPLDAIRDLLKENSFGATHKASRTILDNLWHRCSFGITPTGVAADYINKLLKLAGEVPVDFFDTLDLHELSMFRAIVRQDLPCLQELSRAFLKQERNAAALLASDGFYRRLPDLKSYSLQDMTVFLDEFQKYVRLLRQVISHPDPLSSVSIKKLFCITEVSDTEYRVEGGSFLYSSAVGDPISPQPPVISLSKGEMAVALRAHLAARLREQVTKEDILCSRAVVLTQCLTFIVNDLDARRYNLRISIHLKQICILQLMYSVNQHLDRRGCVLGWLSRLYEAFNPISHAQGSIADLNLSMIPGAHEGLCIMKEWVRDALYALRANHSRRAFLTNVLKLANLIFTFDGPGALRCVTQAPFNTQQARVQEFIDADGRYVFEHIVRLFDGTQQTCISAGLSLLRHVLKSELYMDLSVFCDCLEEVVSKISISWGLSSRLPLDGLVLPRSWLASNKDFSSRKDTRIVLIMDALHHVQHLLVSLQSNRDGANRIYSLSRTKLTPMLCNVFIARICRALGLLHHNVRNPEVRSKIKSIFDTLGRTEAVSRLYRRYASVPGNKYLGVMVRYDADAKVVVEDLVQLIHKQRDLRQFPPLRLQRVRGIQFAEPSEIPSLLASQLAMARAELPAEVMTSVVDQVSLTERPMDEENEAEVEAEVHEEPEELPPALDEPILSREHEPTKEEMSAANKIKAAYRTYRKHREAQLRAIGKGLEARRNSIFIECLKNVYATRWGKTPYRTIYLWALPHLVVCLEKAISIAHESKNETKGLLSQEGHEHLEVLGKKMNMLNALLKDGYHLRRTIEPNAVMHQAKDKNMMKQVVSDVKDFVCRLPIPIPDPEVQKNLRAAYELVMVEKQQIRPKKPVLNTEDL